VFPPTSYSLYHLIKWGVSCVGSNQRSVRFMVILVKDKKHSDIYQNEKKDFIQDDCDKCPNDYKTRVRWSLTLNYNKDNWRFKVNDHYEESARGKHQGDKGRALTKFMEDRTVFLLNVSHSD
jgi:hypothetical protein